MEYKRITGTISIQVNTISESPYTELDYKCDSEPIKYIIYLVSVPSNIGVGKVWYFLCPNTGKRCRKLYMINTYFLHRSAFKITVMRTVRENAIMNEVNNIISIISKFF